MSLFTPANLSAALARSVNPQAKDTALQIKRTLVKGLWLATLGLSAALLITGCQTTKQLGMPPAQSTLGNTVDGTNPLQPVRLNEFNIRGKMGVIVPRVQNMQGKSGSAFYVWAQEGDRFAIDITGALGIGHTVIEYNGSTATLVSEKTGALSAADPETLLTRATGWQAPISQLPYWISGHAAPSDSEHTLDELGRLQTATNSTWTASFSYDDAQNTLPEKIKIQRPDGYRVILTIDHAKS